jgi:hypothetical protein
MGCMSFNDIPKNDAERIDQFAWQAIRTWPVAAGFDPICDGLDFEQLTRWSLWDKVGRAIRAETDPEAFRLEEKTVVHRDWYSDTVNQRSSSPLGSFKPLVFLSRLKEKAAIFRGRGVAQKQAEDWLGWSRPAIYIPHPSARLERAAAGLMGRGFPVIVSDPTELVGYAGAHHFQRADRKNRHDTKVARRLHAAVSTGLNKQGISLLPYDSKLLFHQIEDQLLRIDRATDALAFFSPAALLLHGDNHAPYQEYVAVARCQGIPTMTFQHGLDCERYYLDDVYASTIAVWSENRRARYEKDSGRQPAMRVTGNPAFDHISSLPGKIDPIGEYMLWITRPHTSKFCYSPSRQPKEGLAILDALLDTLAKSPRRRLIVKAHPQDYRTLYRDRIDERDLTDRAAVSGSDLKSLLPNAKIVISEDSTGGLDAMLQGKILIHAHFAESAPVLPFCHYGAALPGFSKEMLAESLEKAEFLSSSELEEMLAGQRLFINHFAGELDGLAAGRQLAFFEEIMTKGTPS